MAQGNNETNYLNIFLMGGFLILAMNVYMFAHPFFVMMGFNVQLLNDGLIGVNKKTEIFRHPLYSLAVAWVFQIVYIIGTRPTQERKSTYEKGFFYTFLGATLYFGSFIVLRNQFRVAGSLIYMAAVFAGYYFLITGLMEFWKSINSKYMDDRFNDENETFLQETRLMKNEFSINIPMDFSYKKKERKGWINVINPFRGTMVIGNPGSGKSYAVIEEYIRQASEKCYTACIYDYKFPDQTIIQYNNFIKYAGNYKIKPRFYVINFDDPEYSHRCNPISAKFLSAQSDAVNASKTLLLNLNKSWIQKRGDFFVESPIALVSALMWYLRIAKEGRYCSLPHLIMFLSKSDDVIFKILSKYEELRSLMTPFIDALEKGAMEQLAGQTASARIPLSQVATKEMFWVFSGNDFDLDINNPEDPKIICVGNNPKREIAYSAPLGLFFTQLIKEINQKHRQHSFICMDEFPSLYTQGIDQLIATARSNKVAVLLGMQDFTQITRDYGKEVADVIINICGNIFCGQVVRETAKAIQDMLGKILQERESLNLNRGETTRVLNTQMEFIIPESKIANFSQGQFAVKVADNFDQQLKLKISNGMININPSIRAHANKHQLPIITKFPVDEEGNSLKDKILQENYRRIREEIDYLVAEELAEMDTFV
jgi:hypothetical protein